MDRCGRLNKILLRSKFFRSTLAQELWQISSYPWIIEVQGQEAQEEL